MRLLDCGCGPGSITVGLAEAAAPGEVIGLDLQPAQIERARLLAAERGVLNVRFEVGDVSQLPFPDASFDAAFAHTLLLHVRDRVGALREIRRVLKPGGVVGVVDDDHGARLVAPPTPLMEEALGLFMKVVQHHGGDPYFARSMRGLLLQAGFARTEGSATVDGGGCWGSGADTRFFAEWMVEQMNGPAFAELVVGEGWADQSRLDAMAAAIHAWGARSDAFFAVMAPAAVGWVSDS
ncbi:MAG: class I SAM-dependent methyltransferase [Chloroflexota bacterium]|nr:class I SAM-dependent methyltransferase [Chloroflexota bacterium]